MQNKKVISELVNGVKSSDLKKSLGIDSDEELHKYMIICAKLLGTFGLIVRYNRIDDKWYLLAEANKTPTDLTDSELATIGIIKYLERVNDKVYLEKLVEIRNRSENTVQETVKTLQKKEYLKLNEDKSIETLSKTYLKINIDVEKMKEVLTNE